MDMLHPIQVEVRLTEPIAPGRWLHAAVNVHSSLDLADVELRLEPVGQAELAGPRKAGVAEIAAGAQYEHDFDVRVPDTEAPQQVQIRVRARAEGAWLERGAVLHLLPRGVVHPGIVSPALSGQQRVLEQPATRGVR